MSESSPEGSPTSEAAGRQYSMSSRDAFSIELPSPHLSLTNGNNNNGGGASLKSPNHTSLKSPNDRRALSFSREGILGSAQRARNLSQSSGDRESATAGLQNKKDSDDGINPLKRRSTDAGSDYPRRRATIAVRISMFWGLLLTDPILFFSVKFAGLGNLAAMVPNPSVGSVLNWAPSASIGSLASSLMLGTS